MSESRKIAAIRGAAIRGSRTAAFPAIADANIVTFRSVFCQD